MLEHCLELRTKYFLCLKRKEECSKFYLEYIKCWRQVSKK